MRWVSQGNTSGSGPLIGDAGPVTSHSRQPLALLSLLARPLTVSTSRMTRGVEKVLEYLSSTCLDHIVEMGSIHGIAGGRGCLLIGEGVFRYKNKGGAG